MVLRTLQFTGTRSTDRLRTNDWRALVTSPKFLASSEKPLHFSLRIVSNRSENITGSGPGKENPSSPIFLWMLLSYVYYGKATSDFAATCTEKRSTY